MNEQMNLDVPDFEGEYEITAEQREFYRKNGYILLRGVASPQEVAAFRPHLNAAVERYNQEKRAMAERDTYGKAFLQIMNLWVKEEVVRRYVLARRFAKIAADLMGVDGIRLYHDQALFKEPGGGPTPWHQDQHYWPLATNHTITMWMPMVDADEKMGTMRFASGSHEVGYLGDIPISDESEAKLGAFLQERGYEVAYVGAMKAGDATFHSGWVLHGAPGNSSPKMREVMTVIYYADGTKVAAADNASRLNDLNTWLPGLKEGDHAASELNPLIYARNR